MNWDAIGALAELAGAISVLGTLIYLAKQIKDNSKLLSTSIYETAMEGYNNINKWSIGDPDLAQLTRRWLTDDDTEMDSSEKFRLDMIQRVYANHIYKLFRLYEDGVLHEKEWQNAGLEAKQAWESSQVGRDFMRDNHFFDDLSKAFKELGDKKISRFD